MVREHGTICRVQVVPQDEQEAAAARFFFRVTECRIDTTADIKFGDNVLEIVGFGFDGRCSFCRYFRLALKRQGICTRVICPFEVIEPGADSQCKVAIGDRYFDQCYLENEDNFRKHLAEIKDNPADTGAHLALGVINEYHGRLVEAISSYWRAYELEPSNQYACARLKQILEFLLEVLSDN